MFIYNERAHTQRTLKTHPKPRSLSKWKNCYGPKWRVWPCGNHLMMYLEAGCCLWLVYLYLLAADARLCKHLMSMLILGQNEPSLSLMFVLHFFSVYLFNLNFFDLICNVGLHAKPAACP